MTDRSGGDPDCAEAERGRRADDELLRDAGQMLAAAVDSELDQWVAACVHRWLPPALVESEVLAEAQHLARAEVMEPLLALLETEVDRQPTNPLTLLRSAARYPSAVLAMAGLKSSIRDPHQVRLFPDDHWDLVPKNFGDIGPKTGEAGIRWGATKAWVHRRRHAVPRP